MCLAIPGQVIQLVDVERGLAVADIGGVRREISIALIGGPVTIGDWVLVHAGFALDRIDEAEARETLALLASMGDTYEQELRELRSSCLTCADAAIEGTVESIDGDTAAIRVGDTVQEVGVELVDRLRPGDRLLCHAGIALERLP
jgi:hydrogenase expression/formation protein HypC